MNKIKPWEPFCEKNQELWKKHITGKKFQDFVFIGKFKEGKPIFTVNFRKSGDEEVVFKQKSRKPREDRVGYSMSGKGCGRLGECRPGESFDKYFEQIYQGLQFFKPFPYSDVPKQMKKIIFLFALISKKIYIPFEIFCHILSFNRICEMKN